MEWIVVEHDIFGSQKECNLHPFCRTDLRLAIWLSNIEVHIAGYFAVARHHFSIFRQGGDDVA